MIDNLVHRLISQPLDFPLDLTKTVLSLIINILVSPLFRLLHSARLRNTYSLVLGLLNVFFLLNQWAFWIILGAVGPYLIMRLVPSRRFLLTVISSIAFLLFIHFYRFLFDYNNWKVDGSTFGMIMVTKVTYYALELTKEQTNGEVKQNKENKQNTLRQYSFFNYIGYCFYFPSVLAGPTFNFKLYRDFVYERGAVTRAPLKQALHPLLIVAIIFIPTAWCLRTFSATWCLESPFYLSLPLIGKILILNFIGLTYRLKYYVGWYLSQTAVNLTGLSFSQNNSYDAAIAGDIRFQFEPNPKVKTQYWSASLQVWLKKVVYEPCYEKTKSSMAALFLTFLISAFWHGVYLVYYVGFLEWAIFIELCKWTYKWSLILPEKIRQSMLLRIVTYVFASSLFNYIGTSMVLLKWEASLLFCSTVYYWGTLLLLAAFALSLIAKPPRSKAVDK